MKPDDSLFFAFNPHDDNCYPKVFTELRYAKTWIESLSNPTGWVIYAAQPQLKAYLAPRPVIQWGNP